MGQSDGYAVTTHDDDLVYVDFLFTRELLYIVNMSRCGGEVYDVAHLYLVRTARYDGAVFAFDGGNVVQEVRLVQF